MASAGSGSSGSSGLLTDLQRMVLNAAVEDRGLNSDAADPATAAKPQATTTTASKSHASKPQAAAAAGPAPSKAGGHAVPSSASAKHERKSHSGLNGRPKKGGCGGKGTWGNPLDPNNYAANDELDPGDPLYDEDEARSDPGLSPVASQGSAAQTLTDYKVRVSSIVGEYFANGEMGEAEAALKTLGCEEYHHHFVKRLVTGALDRHDRQKEMAAQLLSVLYGDAIAPVQIAKGFTSLLEAADDLALDCPSAAELLSIFLARAVVDDILPPAYLINVKGTLGPGSVGLQAVNQAESRLKERHHAELLEKVWVGEGGVRLTAEAARGKVRELLKEYVLSQDAGEAMRAIRELKMPFFHHEVVRSALVLAMEAQKEGVEEALLQLLQRGAREGVLSASQLDKGFARVLSNIDDLALDVPAAPKAMTRYVARALSQGWLTRGFDRQVAPMSIATRGTGGGAAAQQDKVLSTFKSKCSFIVMEYFSSGDAKEASRSLKELEYPDLLHHFIKRLISLAMDRNNREREMASLLLSSLYGSIIPLDQMESGFLLLLEAVEDLALDIPNAPDVLSLFIARAVVDDILPPHFVTDLASGAAPAGDDASPSNAEAVAGAAGVAGSSAQEGEGHTPLVNGHAPGGHREAGAEENTEGGSQESGADLATAPVPSVLAKEVVRMAQALLSARHSAERILRCWGGSGGVVVTGLITPSSSNISATDPPDELTGSDGPKVAGAGAPAAAAVYSSGATDAESGSASSDLGLADAKAKIAKMLEEYEGGGDLQEACRCLRDLNMPFFHHEVVKKAVIMALEHRSDHPLDILREGTKEWIIQPSQVEMGLHRVVEALPDLTLDIPDATKRMDLIVLKGKNDGWIPECFKYE